MDTLPQAAYLHWLVGLTTWVTVDCHQDIKLKEQGHWRPSGVRKAEAVEQAGAMADRFHRMMMRTI